MQKQIPFKPSTEITFNTVQSDSKRLRKYCLNKKRTHFALDLSEVTRCDSAGLALLIEAKRLTKSQNKTCHFNHMPKSILALAQFCGVDAILLGDS